MLETSTQTEYTSSGYASESPSIDAITRKWIRNKSDELAADAGCRFDEERGQGVVDWIERYCNLWEGSKGPMKLADWQYEATMRMFGWVKWSERLDRWVRRFTKASIYIPKKNGKTPSAAAWGLYLLAGDGEDGNHVFFAAADGLQARLAAQHVRKMIDASPELDLEIKTNLTEMKFTHLPTGSDARPISSGDKTAAKSKQGLNGCVIIDETHVVSRQFISESSIDRMGATRDEPMHIEVSTAGKDPDSYGRQQYEYGKSVENGEVHDQGFFFLCYEAPHDLTDADLDADPVKWGRLANPTWGRLIHEEEYLADYNRSKRSMADLADFKTFRLNIWQQASHPWLRAGDWKACERNFSEADMLGRIACAGLDLSKTYDMTALVLVFPWEDDAYRVLPYFFLPETAVQRLAVKFPQFLDWVARGHIIETPGNVTYYRAVVEKFKELAEKFTITRMCFDPNLGTEGVVQQITEEVSVLAERFAQTIMMFNPATQEFERLVIDGKLEHNGNPCMTWQIGHTQVKTDANCNKRPVKPEPEEPRKIDGVVAAVMGLAAAMKEGHGWSADQGL